MRASRGQFDEHLLQNDRGCADIHFLRGQQSVYTLASYIRCRLAGQLGESDAGRARKQNSLAGDAARRHCVDVGFCSGNQPGRCRRHSRR